MPRAQPTQSAAREALQRRATTQAAVRCSGLLGSGHPPVDSQFTFVSLDAFPTAEPLVPKHREQRDTCCHLLLVTAPSRRFLDALLVAHVPRARKRVLLVTGVRDT